MNQRRMIQLARELETPKKLSVKFNMCDFIQSSWLEPYSDVVSEETRSNCGTSACIAGLACLMFGKDGSRVGSDQAEKLLGLTEDQADRLFFNNEKYIANFTPFHEINREQAANAIRRMVREEGGK